MMVCATTFEICFKVFGQVLSHVCHTLVSASQHVYFRRHSSITMSTYFLTAPIPVAYYLRFLLPINPSNSCEIMIHG